MERNDLTRTIATLEFDPKEYTMIACRKLRRLANSEEFKNEDDDSCIAMIKYLNNEIDRNGFHKYLKRYVYEAAGIYEDEEYQDFEKVEDEVYIDIIRNSFKENDVPKSFGTTSKKWTATIKGWLTNDKVHRETVFLIGLGLKMEPEDVEELLIKGIKEDKFDLRDKDEAIYYYCYLNQYGYHKAEELKEKYKDLEKCSHDFGKDQNFELKEMLQEPDPQKREEKFLDYLAWLKQEEFTIKKQEKALYHLNKLLLEAKAAIAEIKNKEADYDEERGKKKEWTPEQIGHGHIEEMLCAGMKTSEEENLKKLSSFNISKAFQNYRLTRQRIHGLLKEESPKEESQKKESPKKDEKTKKRLKIERFDLITLNFLIYALKEDKEFLENDKVYYYDDEEIKRKRLDEFLESMHEILNDCGMGDIYPPNPYENHILLCLLTSNPLCTYTDVWEKSRDNN